MKKRRAFSSASGDGVQRALRAKTGGDGDGIGVTNRCACARDQPAVLSCYLFSSKLLSNAFLVLKLLLH